MNNWVLLYSRLSFLELLKHFLILLCAWIITLCHLAIEDNQKQKQHDKVLLESNLNVNYATLFLRGLMMTVKLNWCICWICGYYKLSQELIDMIVVPVVLNTVYSHSCHECIQAWELLARKLQIILVLECQFIRLIMRLWLPAWGNEDVHRGLRAQGKFKVRSLTQALLEVKIDPLSSIQSEDLTVWWYQILNLLWAVGCLITWVTNTLSSYIVEKTMATAVVHIGLHGINHTASIRVLRVAL